VLAENGGGAGAELKALKALTDRPFDTFAVSSAISHYIWK